MNVVGHRIRLAACLMLAGLLTLTGCANLPDSSAPQALGTIDRAPTSSTLPQPIQGRDPDLLLRDFLQASADPSNRHEAARQYLSPKAAAKWNDAASITILESADTLRESRSGDTATYQIRGRKLGELEPDGSYRAVDGTSSQVEKRMEMVRVGGEWRIDELQAGVLVIKTAFEKSYRRYVLYFPNAAGTAMVPDIRWIAERKDQLTTRLLTMLAAGPQPELLPATRNMLSGAVSVHGGVTKANGQTDAVGVGVGGVQIDFAGASTLDQRGKELLAAQVVLTLSGADILGPYVLLADGKPLDERYAATGWSAADINAMNPAWSTRNRVGLHAVRDGSLVKVDVGKNEISPVPGYFGSVHNLQSVGLSQDGQLVAAVADSGQPAPQPPRTLVIGTYDGASTISVEQGETFTRPSWTADGTAAWTVVDGQRVIRVVNDRRTGTVSKQDVDISALFAPPADPTQSAPRGPITELRVDRSGARAALIANGKVYVAVIVPQPNGRFALASPLPVAVSVASRVVSLDWFSADRVIFVREGNVEPVDTVPIDGYGVTPLTAQNLTWPVRVVSASPDFQYVADARAVLQLQSNEPSSERFWREVYNLGPNAVPVLPG
ncbi:MtrAB system accessory lipoprotein LpqB [Nocardia sp. CDC159]|uniref:Lipoprotein LpqB n=1 Tax=Nocardia pulmonis TaxID=2951408 RepID=A0A9X2E7G5_9NOCA|nr:MULTISPECIES: MtrAB system accessory lipoprotein LpqB [Nocardia]MCM6775722.1 MtrAB system accessory lipoprotein LpqB [Nocardia pulmonis]MCM6788302.1 MtrAB system accessory lipoprotein LpqB [Nocardia sp. CDC159]